MAGKHVFLAALALIALSSLVPHVVSDGTWSRPPTPVNPLQVNKPANWTKVGNAECPRDCNVNGCCTQSWDQVGGVGSIKAFVGIRAQFLSQHTAQLALVEHAQKQLQLLPYVALQLGHIQANKQNRDMRNVPHERL